MTEAYLRYAAGLIKQNDKNGDNALSAEEWTNLKKDASKADTDGDGKISALELAVWYSNQ